MIQLLDTVIDDIKTGKIKIVTGEVFYPHGKNGKKPYNQKIYFARYANGTQTRISKKIRAQYEEVLLSVKKK